MKFLLHAGVSDEHPHYLNDKIKISNQVALLMALVGLCYAVFSGIFYPKLIVYPAFCFVFSFGAIWLNYLGWYNIARFVLSTLLILLAYLYHGFLVQPGEELIPSMYMIEFALTVIPWVLVDFREKPLLIFSLVACYLLIFSQTWANGILDIELDSSLFRVGFLNAASYVFAVFILISCLLFMQNKNYISEVDNEKLVNEIHDKSEKMQQQQEELQSHLDELRATRQEEEKQSWVATGLANITEILRQQDDDQVYQELLRAIIKYIEANQGGIYLAKEDEVGETYLDLVACYAYDREKFVNKRFEIGQGLIGQSYLEKETILLKEIPQDYITITSGLGEATPTFLAIIPLLHEELVVGILEIALFQELEEYRIDFLNKLGHSIASFVSANNLNIKTRKLLEQSQLQMEQLRAQEEEMRQNMEELQATQEEMQRKEKEYLGRIEEMEKQQDDTKIL